MYLYPFICYYTLLSFYYFYLIKNKSPTLQKTHLIVYVFSCIFTASSPWEMMKSSGDCPMKIGTCLAPFSCLSRNGRIGGSPPNSRQGRGCDPLPACLLAGVVQGGTLVGVPDQVEYCFGDTWEESQ